MERKKKDVYKGRSQSVGRMSGGSDYHAPDRINRIYLEEGNLRERQNENVQRESGKKKDCIKKSHANLAGRRERKRRKKKSQIDFITRKRNSHSRIYIYSCLRATYLWGLFFPQFFFWSKCGWIANQPARTYIYCRGKFFRSACLVDFCRKKTHISRSSETSEPKKAVFFIFCRFSRPMRSSR